MPENFHCIQHASDTIITMKEDPRTDRKEDTLEIHVSNPPSPFRRLESVAKGWYTTVAHGKRSSRVARRIKKGRKREKETKAGRRPATLRGAPAKRESDFCAKDLWDGETSSGPIVYIASCPLSRVPCGDRSTSHCERAAARLIYLEVCDSKEKA